jgi:hypothetical protein
MSTNRFAILFIIFGVCIFGNIVFQVSRKIITAFRRTQKIGWIPVFVFILFGFIGLWGVIGFGTQWIIGAGALKLPQSFNWPAGWVRGAVLDSDGNYIVPIIPVGRIQIYDSQLHFLRGWSMATGGKDFTLYAEPGQLVRMVDYRKQQFWFSEDGTIQKEANAEVPQDEEQESSSLPAPSMQIPTAPPFLVFASPIVAWIVAVFGCVGMAMVQKILSVKLN